MSFRNFSNVFRRREEESDPSQQPPPELFPRPPDPPVVGLPDAPYADSNEHLWDELRRIDQLIRAQTVRWRMTLGNHKPAHQWGMVDVSDEEIDAFIQSPFQKTDELPPAIAQEVEAYWDEADRIGGYIHYRLGLTPAIEQHLRLIRLQKDFNLSSYEVDVLLVCLLSELDQRYRRLFGYLQDDASRTLPTLELIGQILQGTNERSGHAVFEAEQALWRSRLVSMSDEGRFNQATPRHAIRIESSVVNWLLGYRAQDERLHGIVSELAEESYPGESIVDDELAARLDNMKRWWRNRKTERKGAALFFYGPYGSGRLLAAQALCASTQTPLLVVQVPAALQSELGWAQIVELVYRDARLHEAAVFWANCEALLEENRTAMQWEKLLAIAEKYLFLTILASELNWFPVGYFRDETLLGRLDFPIPSYPVRLRLWRAQLEKAALQLSAPALLELAMSLANSFQLTGGQIIDAVTTAWSLAFDRDLSLTPEDLYAGCRFQSGRRLISMARRIEPRSEIKLADLIIPPQTERQLQELLGRIQNRSRVYGDLRFEERLSRGKGVIALFTGSSGTGKTMAAEVLARKQEVDLYRVDLSSVVSKYVGETEKHLNQVFAEAESSNAVLFFDEADAIFGKRGEVKEAQDRWANLEVNYLLQRIEDYSGVVILASNLGQNIDEAFRRRIHVVVEFPFPDETERLRLWQSMFAPGIARPSDDELATLVKFRLAGGNIRNIVVDAGFRASRRDTQPLTITLEHLALSIAREYQKLGKPITRGEFGEPFFTWIQENKIL